MRQNKTFVYVLVYVDDILVTGSNPAAVKKVISSLATHFSIKDMEIWVTFSGLRRSGHPKVCT